MRTSRLLPAAILLAAFIVSGCLRSLHPLYSDKTLVFDQNLVGSWVDQDSSMWTFIQTGQKSYELVYTEKGSPGRFKAHLVKLGKFVFLDLFPEEPVLQNGFYKFHLVPVHSILRVWIEENTLRMAMLDHDWFKNQVDKKKVKLAHEHRGNEIILTAATDDLQKFVVKYANDPKAFPEPGELRKIN
ncbi:MAG: hypothetical protein HYY49_06260 [Ignavibacteriales bacterium]|nr:hypothetical protein [Ignavibacteriales bacterium]